MKQTVKNIVMTTVLILSTTLQGVTADDGSLSLVGEISELSDLAADGLSSESQSDVDECYDIHRSCMKRARMMPTLKKKIGQQAYCFARLSACLIAAADLLNSVD